MSSALQELLIPPIAPDPVPWWPPAPGWWLIGLAGLLLGLSLPWVIGVMRRHGQKRLRLQQALQHIPEDLPDPEWLAALNTLIKRHAKQRGDEAATRLYGQAWLDYLCRSYPKPQRQALEPLASDLYRPTLHLNAVQRHALRREVLRWIRHNHA